MAKRWFDLVCAGLGLLALAPALALIALWIKLDSSGPVLLRRGLELSVSGSYAELVRYVNTLESALPTLRWGTLHLKSAKQPPELTLQVFVVGAPP